MNLQASQQVAKPFYDTKVQPSTLIPKQVGNMYTASIYAAFASLLHNKHSTLVIILYFFSFQFFGSINNAHKYENSLFLSFFIFLFLQAGQRVILFSYGSGLAATMFSLRLNEGQHPFSLSNIATVMNVSEKLKSRHEVYLLILVLFSS